MKTPRDPDLPPARAARPRMDRAVPPAAAEPFVRLAALAPRDRGAAPASTYEERAGALIRRAAPPEGLTPRELDGVWERLAQRGRPGANLRGVWAWRWALAAVVLTLSGGAVAAGTGVWPWPRTFVRQLIDRPSEPSRSTGARLGVLPGPTGRWRDVAVSSPAGGSTPPIASPPAAAPGSAPEAAPPEPTPSLRPALPRRADTVRRVADGTRALPPPAPTSAHGPSATDTTLSEEGQLLGRALARLRQDRDPAGALVELDRYAARFPSGILGREAQIARVDALLMAGRSGEARRGLSGLILGADARDRELRLIRAELAAESACATALEDYQAVWAAHPAGPLGERALWGQAACHARLGDEASARADLAHYLERFPDGAHAAAARARLRN